MNNSNNQRSGQCNDMSRVVVGHLFSGVIFASALFAGLTHAAGEVSQIKTVDEPATPTRYEIDGTTYTWGMGTNQVMEGFTAHSQSFQFSGTADRVELVRNNIDNVSTGNPCGVFVERLGASSEVLKANYPSDGSDTGNCDMAAMLASRVVNRGALNLFSNIGPNPKNVERVDYLYDHGVLAPLTQAALAGSGHVVAEKSGNNPLQIAAVTKLDVFGQPAAYGPLIYVHRNGSCTGDAICYGITNLRHNYSFFQNNSNAPQGYPSFLKDSTESVGMAFISLETLGIEAGDVYYGYSYFADDVDEKLHTLTDVTTFPQDTDDEKILFGDGPDIYGGVAGYFLSDDLNIATGAVFKDENGDGVHDEDEAGISDIGLSLYEDTNGDGVFTLEHDTQLGSSFNTDMNGDIRVPGLEDGVYFLLLDESDPDLPPAISLVPGSNPAMIVINGNDADGINFGFISDTGPTDGGSDSGDTGGADSGNTGGADSGNTGGATDTGGTDSGNTGGTDTGNTDDGGATDSGATDSGNTDGATDTGGTDSGNTGGTDTGSTDDGGTDSGTTDSGGTDSGGTDSGTTDPGTNDGGFLIINDGANETVANPDAARVTQGMAVTIDVLANDTDASGQGLTIVGEPTSSNATIVVQDGMLVYTPNFGFIGGDSFLYVIEDGAATQSTGTVNVSVVRFSDINDNGLNDFDECDCDNLTIEVGVEGSALGASSIMSFLLLTLMLGLRRFARFGLRGALK